MTAVATCKGIRGALWRKYDNPKWAKLVMLQTRMALGTQINNG